MFLLTQAYIYDQDGDLTASVHYIRNDIVPVRGSKTPDYCDGPRWDCFDERRVSPVYIATWDDSYETAWEW